MVSSRWIYKVKQAADGSVEKHKAIFVAIGFSQLEEIDYEDTFSPVTRLKRVLYGLKQAPRAWYTRIDNYFTRLGFTKCDEKLVKYFKGDLAREFEMKDLRLMNYFLGMEVWQVDEEVFVSHGKYANRILKKFHMKSNKPMETPLARNWRKEDATSGEVVEATIYKKLVGSLMYIVNT
eukprot:PITA_31951